MSEPSVAVTGSAADGTPTAGAMLQAGREAAGLTLEAAALQLKLAPRQVQALERNDFAQLPGRTFVRGFIRNYARLLRIDAQDVLAALPDGAGGGTHAGSLAPSPQSMGELPAEVRAQVNWVRWLIPLAMAAVVGVTAYFELVRPKSDPAKAAATVRPADATNSAVIPAPSAPSPSTAAPSASGTPVPLANPLAPAEGAKMEGAKVDSAASGASGADRLPAKTEKSDAPPSPLAAPAASALAGSPMVIDFRGSSWVQVKDGTGAILLSLTGNPGTTQIVTGTPPFDVVVGNIDAVSLTFAGKPVDLSMYSKQNVARMTLK